MSAAPSVGVLSALGPIGAIASMAEMAFTNNFGQMMQHYNEQRLHMSPTQIRAESQMLQEQRQTASNLARRALGARITFPTLAKQVPRVTKVPQQISLPQPAPLSSHLPSIPASPLLSGVVPKEGNVGFLSGLSKVFGGVGTAISDVRGIVSAIHPAATAAGKAATVAMDAGVGAAKAVGRTVAAHPVIAAAGAAATAAAGVGAMSMGGGKAAAKTHLKNIAKGLGLHHRRMHATNVKALHRALRRVKGFERVARRVLRITMTKPHKVHFKFRKHRRAA